MGHFQDEIKATQASARELRERIPDVYEGFVHMHRAAFTDGALSPKTKELIAVGIAISDRCEGCIASHTRMAVRHGATEQEFAEALGVAIQMNGGPGTVYAPKAWAAYQEFKERYG
ncbi:MAG: carboxymuconolactone decarboxylase family protein [Acidimicrobiia bacterium]|nr:carboxymuconolactone decarboxylase family protein [Acidimicrobiia bacterium]